MARDYAKLIGSLIAHAEDEGNSEEARATYRAKAEELMREYRIAEEETIATDQFSILPGRFEIVLLESNGSRNPMRHDYVELFREIANHAGIRFVAELRWKDQPYRDYDECAVVAVCYGYEMDVRVAEFYWTAARLVFMTRIDARVDPKLSDQENCYYLRNSGISRINIAAMLWGEETRTKAAPHAKVQKLYLAECEKRGEEPKVAGRGIQVKLYREAYANAFVSEFGWRLREARDGADSKSGGLTLHGRKERVAEAFYAAYPHHRPMSEEELKAYRAQRAAAPKCPKCTDEKKCRQHRPREATQADYRRWDRESNGPEARAGRANGAAAARAVNVSRTAGARTQSADAAPTRPQIG